MNEFVETFSENTEKASYWLQKLQLEAPDHPQHDKFVEILDKYNKILKQENNTLQKIVSK